MCFFIAFGLLFAYFVNSNSLFVTFSYLLYNFFKFVAFYYNLRGLTPPFKVCFENPKFIPLFKSKISLLSLLVKSKFKVFTLLTPPILPDYYKEDC